MSSRQLRKLQQQRELEKAESQVPTDDSSDEEPVQPTKSKASLFASLAALEDEGDNEEGADPNEEEEVEKVTPSRTPQSAAKKSKKKKKKAKKAKAKELEHDDDQDHESEDIDAIIKELNLNKKAQSDANGNSQLPVDPEYERVCVLLSIGSQHLKVANEMRRLFGKEATEVGADEDESGQGSRRRRGRGAGQPMDLEASLKGHHKPGQGLSSLTIRRNNLIGGKQDWPKATTGGLTMAIDNDGWDDGTVIFRFVHDEQYQRVQDMFNQAVAIGEPQALIVLLYKNPYHVSLLIQVSKIARNQGDHALASDLLERALFTMGRAATSVFNIKMSQGKARLDFRRPENRVFWLAGYHYIKSLMMKGTYRTALEWANCLLSMDPDTDPYSMRLIIHQLALKAGEDQWLLDFEACTPGMWSSDDHGAHTSASSVLAAANLGQSSKCRELLLTAMQKYPWLFGRLFKELSLDAPKSIWGILPRTDAEKLYTELYVLQTKELWNTPAITALLMEVSHTIPVVDVKSIPISPEASVVSLNVVRYIYLDDNPTLMALVPGSLLHRSNNSDSDPLPPDENIFSYESQKNLLEGGSSDRDRGFRDEIEARLREYAGLAGQLGPNEEDDPTADFSNDEGDVTLRAAGRQGFLDSILQFMGMRSQRPEDEGDESGEGEQEESSDEDMPPLVEPGA